MDDPILMLDPLDAAAFVTDAMTQLRQDAPRRAREVAMQRARRLAVARGWNPGVVAALVAEAARRLRGPDPSTRKGGGLAGPREPAR